MFVPPYSGKVPKENWTTIVTDTVSEGSIGVARAGIIIGRCIRVIFLLSCKFFYFVSELFIAE